MTLTIQTLTQWIINHLVLIAAFLLALSMILFIFGKEDRGAIYLALQAIGSILLFNIIR